MRIPLFLTYLETFHSVVSVPFNQTLRLDLCYINLYLVRYSYLIRNHTVAQRPF
jgi:hypothetical protein